MTLTTGTRLGPYEVLSLLGKGGMGEVYRAKDDRLGRDVAIKVLPPSFASDTERLKRFEQEARAAGQLNHPNVLAIHDIGIEDKTPYIVSELLEGESLRDLLVSGPLPARRAAAYAIEVANGLAAAHAKGIVHRDLKPENLQILPGGRVKILDFGIAKLTRDSDAADDAAQTLHSLTVTGAIMGTASYMAPEQIRDQPTDQRTDIFALGAILYEMLTAQKAFPGETPADRMSAILNSEPPGLPSSVTDSFPSLDAIVRRCLGKRPEDRFDSARDLAFTLGLLVESGASGRRRATSGERSATAGATDLLFRRLTFREGDISAALIAPDGQTVVYSAAWEGRPFELFVTRFGSPESRPLGLENALLLSVSSSGEIAVCLRPRALGGFITVGTLARVPLIGGTPRELLDGVYMADWGPDGKSLAVIREVEGVARLDYPIGKTLYQTAGWTSNPRVSPDGRRIAFLHHPIRGDSAGEILLLDMAGKVRRLAGDYETAWKLAWSPNGESVWVSATRSGGSPGIHAVDMDGSQRPIHQSAGYVGLLDTSPAGETLLMTSVPRMRIEFRASDASEPIDLSWLDWGLIRDMTPDGRTILFDETGLGGGDGGSVYMRATDGSPAVRLGDGVAMRLSPDQRWVLATHRADPTTMILLPTGAGENILLPTGGIHFQFGTWMPDGKSLCFGGNEPGRRMRLYLYDIERRKARPITEEGVAGRAVDISPDGRFVVAGASTGGFALFPIEGGVPRSLEGFEPSERPIGWSDDGAALWVLRLGHVPAPIYRFDLATGRRELWKEISPRSRNGVDGVNNACLSPDGKAYVASYMQMISELYAVHGLG